MNMHLYEFLTDTGHEHLFTNDNISAIGELFLDDNRCSLY